MCAFSHLDFPEPRKINYSVWDFILFIWGLEAYICHKQGDEERCAQRISAMLYVRNTPNSEGITAQKTAEFHKNIRDRLTFDDAINKPEIERSLADGKKSWANDYRFGALKNMIGCGVTGLYPQLEARKDELEEKIREYISLLQ